MKREELEELHYISPIANIPSIVQHGILSQYILGVYISCQEALNNFEKTDVNLPAIINKNMFFL